MTQDRDADRTDRRAFLQAGALATASAISLSASASAQDAPAAQANPVVPRRKLGKTGVEITMLDQGAVRGPSLDGILRDSPTPRGSASSTPPRSMGRSPTSRSGSRRRPRSARKSSWSPRMSSGATPPRR